MEEKNILKIILSNRPWQSRRIVTKNVSLVTSAAVCYNLCLVDSYITLFPLFFEAMKYRQHLRFSRVCKHVLIVCPGYKFHMRTLLMRLLTMG